MSQIIGEIKLFAYRDVPTGWIKCEGQYLNIHEYPKLYMMIGTNYGEGDKHQFKAPDLRNLEPSCMTYCIAAEGRLPEMADTGETEGYAAKLSPRD